MHNPSCSHCVYLGKTDRKLVFLCMGQVKQLAFRSLNNGGYSDYSVYLTFLHSHNWDEDQQLLGILVSIGLLDKRSADKVSSGLAIDEKEARLDRFA